MKYKTGYLVRANEGVYDVIRTALGGGSELVTLSSGMTPLSAMRDLDFVIAGTVTPEMMAAAPKLKLILAPGIGVDGIDLEEAAARSIPVACTIAGNVIEVAEHAILLMLAVSRRLTELDAALRQGRWLMWDRRVKCRNLLGRTLGIVGYGRIGQEIGIRATALGMDVRYADPERPGSMRLDDLLGTSDYVCLSVPLTSETRSLMNRERLLSMKQGAILINVARGEIVDEPALIEARQSGRLSGAGLDVFATEPPESTNPLLAMPNVVVTPHVGSGTLDGLRVKAAQYAENIRRFLAGEPLLDCIQTAVVEAAAR
jgi:phosphoglycerate dehydrogenase-like enzyme